ncbi:MAG: fimbrillin family protein [Candidatus Cryptobacteroides sp.]
MKKVTFMFAAFALLAASCTKTELVNGAQENLNGIGFSAYTAKHTKAAQEDVKTANFTSFEVSAIGNGAIYFDNVTFEKNVEGVWASTPVYFWPAYKLNFYAYNTPANGHFSRAISTDAQTLSFKPSTVLAEQEDLVAAYAANQSETSGATPLTFNHYLTQIAVKALNTNSTYSVEVAGVKLAHLSDKGVYTFSSNTIAKAGDAADQNYSADFTKKTLTATAQEVMTDGGEGRWYLVPQTVTAWDKDETTNSSKGTYLALKVKITANSGALKIYPADDADYAWMAVPVPASQEFKQGHKYTFVIKFFENNGAGYVDPEQPGELDGDTSTPDNGKSIIGGAITFNATVSEWAPETEIVISL